MLAKVIREAIPYLQMAEKDYATLQMATCQQDVLYFLASVYNTLGMLGERDAAAARHRKSVEEGRKWIMAELSEEMKTIWWIVTEVGSAIAAGSKSTV